jgi:ABC-type transport system substrate-binding protein
MGCLLFCISCRKKDSDAAAGENVWRRPLFTKLQTLDAGNLSDAYSLGVASQIYEPLYQYKYLVRPFEMEPLTAEDFPKISDDHLTYTIKIKKGILFQDDPCFPDGKGRELKASDYVYAIKRIANVKYRSQNWSGLDGRIVGLDAFREYTKGFSKELDVDYSTPVEGLQALDDYTLQIKLTKPWPQLAMNLSLPPMAPVAREAVEYYKEDISYHPVGTGPYKLKTWQRGFYIELVRNENWHGGTYPAEGAPGDAEAGLLADAGKPLPFIDRLVYREIEEFQPAWLMFKRGELEWMQTFKDNFNEAVNVTNLTATKEMTDRGIKLVIYEDPSVFWLGFNMQDPVLGKNKPLRMAISRAIDRQTMIDLFFNGVHQIAHGVIYPQLPEYNPENSKLGYSKYDPAEAKALVQEAIKVHGGPIPPLTLYNPGTGVIDRQTGQFLQKYFEQVGLTLQVEYMDWPTYLENINKGKHQLFFSGVGASIPDALGSLELFGTKYMGYGGNHFFYSNPEYDALLAEAEVAFPGPKRTELFRKMERMILDEYVAVWINHRTSTVLRHSWFLNYKPNVFTYNSPKYWKIDVEKRNEYKDLLKELEKKAK